MDLNMLEKAIPYLEKAIQLDPADAESYNFLGVVYHDLNMLEKAIPYLEKAIKLDPFDAEA